ncbi:MAG: class I SAM-dependent methyltransferase [Acidobacteria bacterium]|nr:class I SAM-dependent methyltransferase [Acidobacteriota bacterium]
MTRVRRERWRVRQEFNLISQRYARAVSAWRATRLADLSWLPHSTRWKILDLACGPGTYSTPLAQRASWVVGLDLSESMLRCALQRRRRRAANLVFLQGDANRIPFVDGEFDLCFCAFSLAHFRHPRKVLEEMTRVLRPRGWLAILDVVAPAEQEARELLNCLETTRESCYTRIREAREFVRLFSGLPLRWQKSRLEDQCISFRRWIAASHLKPGTVVYQRAQRRFWEATAWQCRRAGRSSSIGQRKYDYTVARFLLRKIG